MRLSISSLALSAFILLPSGLVACGGGTPTPQAQAAKAANAKTTAQAIFEMAAPSVVAILNDDREEREKEIKEMEKTLGDESKAPKHVVDVSLRKEPMPHGTGFMIEGGQILTAAHVVLRPDLIKLTTRFGQTVGADVVRIDEVRDVAVLKPKEPLKDVPPLKLADADPEVGQMVWAMGHTGMGFWKLSWGMSEGIASGIVDMFGAKLLLFDAAVYPGFSGGPVVVAGADGRPRVVGVNHAILFTGTAGFFSPIGPVSSAVTLSELREAAMGRPPAIEAVVAEYAKKQRDRKYADLFVTDRLSVARDANDQQVAMIIGNNRSIDSGGESPVKFPAVAMIFGLDKGSHDVTFEVHDPTDSMLASETTTVRVKEKQRVSFASTSLRTKAKTHGKYAIVAKEGDKELGRTFVNVELEDDDEELSDENDADASDDGDPDVDIVVAQAGRPDPLAMLGIREGWAEKSYPRRVDFTWFARATRGWTGTFVSITAFVLDQDGHIAGRADGCFKAEVRPEHPWACMGQSGAQPAPMAGREGPYDIVFAINDRPVAWWPMEAIIRQDHAPGSDVERWMKDLHRVSVKRRHKDGGPGQIPETPKPPQPPKPPTPPKPPVPPPPKKNP